MSGAGRFQRKWLGGMGVWGRGCGVACGEKQWGAQENLWPKFILKSAPLRATSSALCMSIRYATRKLLKIQARQFLQTGRNCRTPRKIYVHRIHWQEPCRTAVVEKAGATAHLSDPELASNSPGRARRPDHSVQKFFRHGSRSCTTIAHGRNPGFRPTATNPTHLDLLLVPAPPSLFSPRPGFPL